MSHPLRIPAFRLFFVGRTLSMIGSAAIPTALSLAVYVATGSTGALALVLTCSIVPRLILLPLGGVVGDRLNARLVAICTDLVCCATQLVVGVELLGSAPQLWFIAVASAIGGAANAFAKPAGSPLIRGIVGPSELLRANALMATMNSATRLGGPAVAGVLIFAAGPGWAFVLDSASFAVSAALLSVIRVRHVPSPTRSLLSDLKEGWEEVRSRDWYWVSLLAHAVWNCAAAILMTLGPALAVEQMGGRGVWVTLVQTGAVGLLAGSLLAGRARLRRPILVANLGLATYALPLGLLAVNASAVLVTAAYGVAQAALGFLGPLWDTSVQSAVPAHALARVASYDWLVSFGAMPLGYVLAPLATSAWGAETVLAVAAAAVTTACVATAAVPSIRRFQLPAPEAPSASKEQSDVSAG